MRPKSLKNTLLLTVAILVVVSGLIISQIVTHRYSISLTEGAVERVKNIAHKLALDATDKILINDLVSLQKLMDDQMRSDPTVSYLFVIQNSRILTHTFTGGIPVHLIKANTTADPKNGNIERIISNTGEHYIDIAWPIFDGGAGTLRLGISEAPYRMKVAQLWIQMSLITACVLILALFVSRLFINRLTRPLLALTEAVEKIDEGNLESHIKVKGRAEVNRLASAFNAMIARLKEYTHKLKDFNRLLAEKNEDLDRSHRQLHTLFHISQEISALADIKEVCFYLIKKFKGIVECQSMTMLIFSTAKKSMFVCSENRFKSLGHTVYQELYGTFKDLHSVDFMEKDIIASIPFTDAIHNADRIAIFPIHYQRSLLGVMAIGCPGKCQCTKKELDVLDLILKQSSGALNRSLRQEEEIQDLCDRLEPNAEFCGIIGKDPEMQVVYKLIDDVAPTDATVLIQGQSGTGKELVARAIHRQSTRRNRPFVVINCSAYPSTLLESELFGHEKGSFTGALRRKIGRFEQADGGTVFLDEIGEIPPEAQIKLLRVLQTRKFERLGSEETLEVNVRILAATNKDLLEEVKKGHFREDLYYRLNVILFNLPPLTKRLNDIPLLAQHFLNRFSEEQNKTITGFEPEAMRMLIDYAWPGNVRELENIIERGAIMAKGTLIDVSDLPSSITASQPSPMDESRPTLIENEKNLVLNVLEECLWNKTEAAMRLGISRSTLYEKLKKFRITAPSLH